MRLNAEPGLASAHLGFLAFTPPPWLAPSVAHCTPRSLCSVPRPPAITQTHRLSLDGSHPLLASCDEATRLPLRRPVSPTSRSLSICPRLRPRPKQTPRLFSHPSVATIRCSRRPLPHRSPTTPPRTGPNSHPTRPPLRRLRSLPQLRKASARPGPRRAVLSRRHRRRRPAAGAARIR